MQRRVIRFSLITVNVIAFLYLTLMIYFESPSPSDIYHYAISDGWSIDSVFVHRRTHHLQKVQDHRTYGTNTDSVWNFSIRLCGQNFVRHSLNIDSVNVINLQNKAEFRIPFLQHYEPVSQKMKDGGFIIGKQPIIIIGSIDDWSWNLLGESASFQQQLSNAFQERSFQVRVHSSRGNLVVTPSHYLSNGEYLEWTDIVQIPHN